MPVELAKFANPKSVLWGVLQSPALFAAVDRIWPSCLRQQLHRSTPAAQHHVIIGREQRPGTQYFRSHARQLRHCFNPMASSAVQAWTLDARIGMPGVAESRCRRGRARARGGAPLLPGALPLFARWTSTYTMTAPDWNASQPSNHQMVWHLCPPALSLTGASLVLPPTPSKTAVLSNHATSLARHQRPFQHNAGHKTKKISSCRFTPGDRHITMYIFSSSVLRAANSSPSDFFSLFLFCPNQKS